MLPISTDHIVSIVVSVATVFLLAWKKFSDLKLPDMKKEHSDILAHIRGEKNDAVRQRDESLEMAEELRKMNSELERKMNLLHDEVGSMKNKLVLLTELNNRLATTLDTTRRRLEEYLESSPQYELSESQRSSSASQFVAQLPTELGARREKDFEEE